MKKYLSLLLMVLMTIMSCQKFDDSEIWDKLNDHEARIAYLEEVCKNMNTSIVNLQAVVTALETNDYIVSASPLVTGDGYTIIFKSGKSIVIYNGKDGADGIDGEDGKDGADGKDGQDGVTPVISVRQDTDGYYYWTVDGEWLIVNGEKVKAAATDGKDGEDGEDGENGTNGADGVTPKFKIENDYWYVSYDNGQTWEKLGKATGNSGFNGIEGDDIFKRVFVEDGYVQFVLNDGQSTIIKLPLYVNSELHINVQTPGTLSEQVNSEQKRTIRTLYISGTINESDIVCCHTFRNLEVLDISECLFDSSTLYVNPVGGNFTNMSLTKLVTPKELTNGLILVSHCISLEHLVVSSDEARLYDPDYVFKSECLPSLKTLEFAEGVKTIYFNYDELNPFRYFVFPSTTNKVYPLVMPHELSEDKQKYYIRNCTISLNAVIPPIWEKGTTRNIVFENCTLLVPKESLDLYKSSEGWKTFNSILEI